MNAIRKMSLEGESSAVIERYKATHDFDPELTGRLMGAAKVFNVHRKRIEHIMRSKIDAEAKLRAIDDVLKLELDKATKIMDYVDARRIKQAAAAR